jgi:hypothetical protein
LAESATKQVSVAEMAELEHVAIGNKAIVESTEIAPKSEGKMFINFIILTNSNLTVCD